MKITTLEEVRRFLSGIDCINYGGCGVSALAMYLWLEKHNQLSDDTKIIYLYGFFSVGSYAVNESFLNGKSNECTSCSHAVLKHNGEIFDCEEFISPSNYVYSQEINGIDFVRESVKNWHDWNRSFNRENIQVIEEILSVTIL